MVAATRLDVAEPLDAGRLLLVLVVASGNALMLQSQRDVAERVRSRLEERVAGGAQCGAQRHCRAAQQHAVDGDDRLDEPDGREVEQTEHAAPADSEQQAADDRQKVVDRLLAVTHTPRK